MFSMYYADFLWFVVIGGMAHWLGCRSFSCWDFPDLWLACDHFVGKVSVMGQQTRPTQPSVPLGLV